MANYTTLKAAIAAAIKQNGNNEITGNLLQQQLLAMVNSLGVGYQYAGVATPATNPGTPDQNVFYLAATGGLYTNFNNAIVYSEELAVLYYNGSWRKTTVKYGNRDIWASFSPGGNRHTIRFGSNSLIIDKGGIYFYYKGDRYRLQGDNDKTFTLIQGRPCYYLIDTAAIIAVGNKTINWDTHPEIFVEKTNGIYPDFTNANLVLFAASNNSGVWEIAGLAGAEFAAQISANYRIEIWNSGTKNVKFSADGKTIIFYRNGFSIYRDDVKVFLQYAATDKEFTFGTSVREYLVIEGAAVNFNANATLNISDFGDYIVKKTSLAETDIVLAWYYSGNFQGGLLADAYFSDRHIPSPGLMAALSNNDNLNFGERKLTISSRGFTVFIDGVRYDIEGGDDYTFDYSQSLTRQYLCLDYTALLRGERTLTATIVELTNTLPSANHIVLLATYINEPQPYGLFYDEYLNQLTKGDRAGDSIFADVETPGKRFAALYNGSGSILTMLFFTDPHTVYNGGENPNTFGSPYCRPFFPSLNYLQKFANMLNVDFVLSGGDWLNNSDTKDMACYELGQIKALLKAKFRECHLLVGNHDTNYQGKETPESANWTGLLNQQTINNLWYNEKGKSYYKIERPNCDIYCFDTGTDGRTEISTYEQEQLAWFANNLGSNTKENIVIAMHIVVNGTVDSPVLSTFAQAIEQMANGFNRRRTITVNGVTYVFNNVSTGKIRCILGGHTHYDYMNTSVAIPILITRNFCNPGDSAGTAVYTFDLIFIDFTAGVLHAVRVGNGNDRTLNLA